MITVTMSEKIINTKEMWIDWAIKLQSIAQAGLYYTKNEFELERYKQIRDIAYQILESHSDIEIKKINDYFKPEIGYKTPKLDSRSVCFKNDKLLLAQEKSGEWAIPGGWVDIDQTLSQNLIKEAKEEAGADIEPKFVIALHDWRSHIDIKFKHLPFQILKVFVMCDLIDINFQENSETLQADFFSYKNLPKLALGKNTKDQIDICFEAQKSYKKKKHWNVVFD